MAQVTPVHAAAAGVAYPISCHVAVATADARWAAVGIAAVAWAVLSVGRPVARALLTAAGVAVAAVLVVAALPAAILLYAPPLALYLALGFLFGRTLLGAREPMVTRFARAERGEAHLPDDLARYTRNLTLLWAIFFAAMACISLSLALWGSPHAWSLFTNLLSYLAVVVFFTAEYVYRRIRYRHHRHLSPADLIRRLHNYRVLGP